LSGLGQAASLCYVWGQLSHILTRWRRDKDALRPICIMTMLYCDEVVLWWVNCL